VQELRTVSERAFAVFALNPYHQELFRSIHPGSQSYIEDPQAFRRFVQLWIQSSLEDALLHGHLFVLRHVEDAEQQTGPIIGFRIAFGPSQKRLNQPTYVLSDT
jgi:hypothetical protein